MTFGSRGSSVYIMSNCAKCGKGFDPAKDTFITLSERKTRSIDFCSLTCLTEFLEED